MLIAGAVASHEFPPVERFSIEEGSKAGVFGGQRQRPCDEQNER